MKKQVKNHTIISLLLVIIAIGVDLWIYLNYAGINWGQIAGWEFCCAFGGYIGYQSIRKGETVFITQKSQLGKIRESTMLLSAFLYAAIMGMQLVLNTLMKYSISVGEQSLAYVFAAPSEEMFFRGFLISLILLPEKKIHSKGGKIALHVIAQMVQTLLFLAFHVNYYGDVNAMMTVICMALIVGIAFAITRDLTSVMFAHFGANFTRVLQWWVTLG